MRFNIRHFETVGSTMDLAAAAVSAGEREGIVFIADEQTAGRGRRGREWASPPGAGLYLSMVLRPPLDDRSARLLGLLTLAAGVAVREGIAAATGFEPELKWPNDVVVDRRKLAGILAEGIGIGCDKQAVVLGIGLNVAAASYPDDVAARATSLETELGRCVDRRLVQGAILDAIARRYECLRGGDADDILRSWRAAAPSAHGARVEWDTQTGLQRGVTTGVDEWGALLVTTSRGLERVVAGDLHWI